MAKKLYVGNLGYDVSQADLEQLLGQHGQVEDAVVIMDRMSGRSKGFGFVEMSNDDEAQAAIDAIDGTELDGRAIKVAAANPPKQRFGGRGSGGGFSRGRRDGGGGGGGRYGQQRR